MATEKMEFQTEVRDMLNLMINSLYSNKEIFLRELVSNAADALDKRRFLSLSDASLLPNGTQLRIDIDVNKEQKKLTITDNGIGMNKEDLINCLGTIARSGTKNFIKNLKDSDKSSVDLIGQFGVGFYSIFMVAKKVEVLTLKAGETQGYLWSSEGTGEFEISECPRNEVGTKITLYLKDDEDAEDFTSEWKIKDIVKKYSGFVNYGIYFHPEATKNDKGEIEVKEEERLNDKTALWRQSEKEVKEEEYKEFYKVIGHDGGEPACWSHSHAEGSLEFWSLVYIPSKAPYNIWQNDALHGLKLYVKKTFIMDDCKDLLPPWLRFVRGVVESEDLPLNVSREILQSNKIVTNIRKHVIKKVLDALQNMADKEADKYTAWWKELGMVLKEGFYMNWEHLDELKKLLRFESTKTEEGKLVSLQEYVDRMPEGQKEIYYLIGDKNAVKSNPMLEAFKAKGYEVLLMSDGIDEFMMSSLTEFGDKKFHDVSRGDVDFEKTEDEKKAEEANKGIFKGLCENLQKVLDEDIKEVRVSSRLKDSPCCLVTSDDAMSAQMERMMKAMGQANVPKSKRILEINPTHPICEMLKAKAEAGSDLGDWPKALYGQALLAEGSPLPNPAEYVAAITKLLTAAAK
ncbi:molecular chaperone HtpG [Fibrobacter sp. UWH5]|uniref:molecular chaperone HtpG n=1 Tax=Fibrobacter sp. UWH5 TaxID=1896211 RepID=UPI000920CE7A|nr:molecular chaperone HtpG [Fibrobacter sp. UWH5]SHK43370.1 molecular chaperone HtpG [Fibrobacter sp. UWH5]